MKKNEFISDINSYIAPNAIITGPNKNRLLEPSTNTSVQIKSKGNYVNCDFERLGQPLLPFLNSSKKGLCKIADNVIFTEKKGEPWVIILELKNAKANPGSQIRATKLLIKYIVSSIERMSKKSYKINYRYVGYSKNNRPPTNGVYKYNDSDFVSIGGTSISLSKLLV